MTTSNSFESNNFFVELTESEMATTTGGTVSSTFLNRWAARVRNGNPNLGRISQRLVNEFYKSGLTSTTVSTWSATATAADKSAWKTAAPLVSTYLTSGVPIAGATPAAVAGVRTYLGLF